MNQYRIAICDDEQYYRDELISLLKTYENETDNKLEICSYSSGEDLLSDKNKLFNILILDVEMKGLSGIDIARNIRKIDDNIIIIFATSHDNYALGAYDVDALGYLVKPVSYTKLKKYLSKAIISIDYFLDGVVADKRYLDIKVKYENIKVEISKIIYIEKRRNVSIIHTIDNVYTCYETLSQLFSKLVINKYIYVHQGYIINFSMIQEVTKTSVILKNYIEIPISRKYYKSTKERFTNTLLDMI